MAENADHQARERANLALVRLEAHEKFCEERGRNAAIFEAEMRTSNGDIMKKIDSGLSRVHNRIDIMWRTLLVSLAGVALALLTQVLSLIKPP